MENEYKLNVDQICSVRTFVKRKCREYVWREGKKKTWFSSGREAGFEFIPGWNTDVYSREQIEKDPELYVEGQKVYYKPHIEITMSNKVCHTKFFGSEKELQEFMWNDKLRKISWLYQ